uniref:Uncharacterized protein n=1 Tax=Candidatus Kentrum sp. DK TaxID=2126562 RepID=A0A450SA44_9GAMM|nr:MAG: hypothetical protein BECKDK2373C_GA0170839_102324 [Candidatus Kentron sp. DK]
MRERQPQRGCVKKRHGNNDATPLGLFPARVFPRVALRATLGYVTQPLRGKKSAVGRVRRVSFVTRQRNDIQNVGLRHFGLIASRLNPTYTLS